MLDNIVFVYVPIPSAAHSNIWLLLDTVSYHILIIWIMQFPLGEHDRLLFNYSRECQRLKHLLRSDAQVKQRDIVHISIAKCEHSQF